MVNKINFATCDVWDAASQINVDDNADPPICAVWQNVLTFPRNPVNDPSPELPPLLALVRDLMFAGKIRATAQAQSVPIKMLRDPAALERETGTNLIVDLNLDGAIP